jgi:transmembrane sensor
MTPDREAMDWALRMGDADADWDAFTLWLEGDGGRAERYDRAALMLAEAEAAVAAVPATPFAANDVEPAAPPPRRAAGRWIGGAVAAALVGAVGLGLWREGPAPYAVATAAGEQRTVALADGSSIVLGGGSRVRLDRGDLRVATVERGEVLFRVRHDAARPFAVQAGGLRLVDLGTVFDVKLAAGRTRVAVAEGAVMVDPGGAALRLAPGQAAVAEGSTLRRYSVEPAEVGSWQDGQAAFDDASLDEVAADLSRQLGRPIHAAPEVARRTFRGTLDVRALKDRPALLGELLDVAVRQEADGWTLDARR